MFHVLVKSGLEEALFTFSGASFTIGKGPASDTHLHLDLEDIAEEAIRVSAAEEGFKINPLVASENILFSGEPLEEVLSPDAAVVEVFDLTLDISYIDESATTLDDDGLAGLEEELSTQALQSLFEAFSDDFEDSKDVAEGQGDETDEAVDLDKELERLNALFNEEGLDSDSLKAIEQAEIPEEAEEKESSAARDPNQLEFSEEEDELEELPAAEEVLDEDDLAEEDSSAEPTQSEPEQTAAAEPIAQEPAVQEVFADSSDETPTSITLIDEDANAENHIAYEGESAEDFEYGGRDTAAQRLFQYRLALAVAAVVILSCTSVLAFYFTTVRRHHSQELAAARGLSDIAMSLTYAQLHNILPFNDNWNDPAYFSKFLENVLAPEYLSQTVAQQSLELKGCEYTVQVYATRDGSRFLTMAIPLKTIRNSLVPKSVIVTGSDDLEIRKMRLGRQWDLVLRDGFSLDFVNPKDITALLRQEEAILLASLNTGATTQGFVPPEALAYFSDEAENYIFNAPRYHKLSEKLVGEVETLLQAAEVEDALVEEIQVEHARLSKLSNLVLYTTGDEQDAQKLAEGLESLSLGSTFFVGYLTLQPDTGLVSATHLLSTVIPKQKNREEVVADGDEESFKHEKANAIDILDYAQHPVYRSVVELVEDRKKTLAPVTRKLIELFETNNKQIVPDFKEQQATLQKELAAAEAESNLRIQEGLSNLYRLSVAPKRSEIMPIFLEAIRANDLDALAPKSVAIYTDIAGSQSNEASPQSALLQEVVRSSDLNELSRSVQAANEWLRTSGNLASDQRFVARNELRDITLRKVSEFVLSPKHSSELDIEQASHRNLVESILNNAGIGDEQARAFYLGEFDQLMGNLRKAENDPTLARLQSTEQNLINQLRPGGPELAPSEKKELEWRLEETRHALEPKEEELTDLRTRVERVPLDTPVTADPKERVSDLGRLGQQIIIEEGRTAPSRQRDARISEAIGLLRQATEGRRTLWQDILEAHNLLIQTPESEIQRLLASDTGLGESSESKISSAVSALKDYIRNKSDLIDVDNPLEFHTRIQLFAQEQAPRLQRIGADSDRILSDSEALQATVDVYVKELQTFYQDYERAKAEGLGTHGGGYHSAQLRHLRQKLSAARSLQQRTVRLAGKLKQLSAELKAICANELQALADEVPVSNDSINQLQARANQLPVPNIIGEQLPRHAEKAFSVQIAPILTEYGN